MGASPWLAALALGAVLCVGRGAAETFTGCTTREWFAAARRGDLGELAFCLQDGMDIASKDEAGCPAVVVAALNRHVDALTALHDAGADLSATCSDGTTALMFAAKTGSLEIVKYLIAAGIDVETEMGTKQWTALTYAAHHAQLEVAKHLHKIDRDLGIDWTGTSVMWAAAVGETRALAHLIEAAASGEEEEAIDVEARDEHGHTAVMWAAIGGELECLQMLVAIGASLKTETHSGWTPLMAASYYGHRNVISFLISEEADVNVGDSAGWTAIMWAAANDQPAAVEQLLNFGASLKPVSGGWDALMAAAANGSSEDTVDSLLARGLRWDRRNSYGQDAEAIARSRGHEELAARFAGMSEIRRYNEGRGKYVHLEDEL